MKASDASRAATLVAALASSQRIMDACSDQESGWLGLIAVGDIFGKNSFGAPDYKAMTMIDIKTTILIVQATDKIIRSELINIGVELP